MVDLIGKRWLLQSLQHFRRNAGSIVPRECQQLLALRLRGNVGLRHGVCGLGRQLARDLKEHRAGEQVVPQRSHVNMLINELTADDPIRTLLGKNGHGIYQFYSWRRRRYRAVDVLELAVRAEAKRVEVARAQKMLFGSRVVSLHPQAAGNPEFYLGVLVINLRRPLVSLQRLGVQTRALQVRSLLNEGRPGTQLVRS